MNFKIRLVLYSIGISFIFNFGFLLFEYFDTLAFTSFSLIGAALIIGILLIYLKHEHPREDFLMEFLGLRLFISIPFLIVHFLVFPVFNIIDLSQHFANVQLLSVPIEMEDEDSEGNSISFTKSIMKYWVSNESDLNNLQLPEGPIIKSGDHYYLEYQYDEQYLIDKYSYQSGSLDDDQWFYLKIEPCLSAEIAYINGYQPVDNNYSFSKYLLGPMFIIWFALSEGIYLIFVSTIVVVYFSRKLKKENI